MVPRDQIEDIPSIENTDSMQTDQISPVSKLQGTDSKESPEDTDSIQHEPVKNESNKSSKETDQSQSQKGWFIYIILIESSTNHFVTQ